MWRPSFFHSYMWNTHILLSYRKVDYNTTYWQMICQCLYFICNKENIKCWTLDFQPPCHNTDEVSGEWRNYEPRIGCAGFRMVDLFYIFTPAWTDNSIVTRWRHAHQSWVRVAPPSDNNSVITRAHAAYDFLCDTAIIVKISYAEHQWQTINIVTARFC